MKKNKLVSLLTRWEVFLLVLLALMCLVFNLQDAARVASGEARRDVFNVANVVRSMRPYMLYSFMTLEMCIRDSCCGAFAENYSVGVCQLMVHDSLDQATQGFVDALTEKMEEAGNTVDIDTQVAGDASLCTTVVNAFNAKRVNLIMANGTPALLADVYKRQGVRPAGLPRRSRQRQHLPDLLHRPARRQRACRPRHVRARRQCLRGC